MVYQNNSVQNLELLIRHSLSVLENHIKNVNKK